MIQEQISEYAALTGVIHELSAEMGNVTSYPTMQVLPGGGFRFCSEREGEPVAMAFYAEGYNAFVLDYTTVTKKADALVLGYPGIVSNPMRALDCPDIVESVNAQTPPSFIFSTRDDQVTPPVHPLSFAQALNQAGEDFELHIFRNGVHGLSLAKSMTSSGSAENVNPIFGEWFPMCVRWLRDKMGDFTLYGVNDGRYGSPSDGCTYDPAWHEGESAGRRCRFAAGTG